jgi:competence protein ComEA
MPDPAPSARPRTRWRTGLAAAVALVVAALAAAVVGHLLRGGGVERPVVPLSTATTAPVASGDVLYVHVLGAVHRPGLYALDAGDRVVDAIAAAGGTTDAADPAGVNLARFVSDGEQLLVPAVGEAPPDGAPGSASGPGSGDLVDLNTAEEATLDELPGIGPALADRIVAWRDEHGRFASVDDLLEVSGIGESVLERLRDLVRV